MKRWYVMVALVFTLGFGLVMFATSSTDAVTLLGLTIQPHVIKGLGLVTMILGVLALLAVYGSSLPPCRAEHREPVSQNNEDLSAGDSRPKRLPLTARRVSRRSTVKTVTARRTVPAEENPGPLH